MNATLLAAVIAGSLAGTAVAETVVNADGRIDFAASRLACRRSETRDPARILYEITPSAMKVLRELQYSSFAARHKLEGLASYYSTSLDGSLTATGEIFRNRQVTAAHLTLPLGTWVQVTSRATGRSIRCRVNDRGPYARKFVLDLSQKAARILGVDRAEDRFVRIRVIALPGEELPEEDDPPTRIAGDGTRGVVP